MKRYNGIDIIRGISMWLMIAGHLIDWWIKQEFYWHKHQMYSFLEPIVSTGFLFASGISTALSYKQSLSRINPANKSNLSQVRNEYIFRAFFILIIAFIYNFCIGVFYEGFYSLWSWYVLQTVGFCLILTWPFLKTPIYIRLIFGFFILTVNPLIFELLKQYEGQLNFLGFTFYFLYHPADIGYTILSFFGIFLIGTVLGDILFDLNRLDNQNERRAKFKTNFIIPTLAFGGFLIIFGVIYMFPHFLVLRTFSSFIYSLGVVIVLLSIFITIQEFQLLTTKKSYKFLFYYSYYSFTIYLTHNLLFFLFSDFFNVFTIWVAIFIVTTVIGVLLNFTYKKVGKKASLKAVIGIFSYELAKRIAIKSQYKFEKTKEIKVS
ncbi:MAG: heparan-alpha-glucosaminide N-acetyltransferase domain-containing protein [Promethearchaeota archaeon]